jgi:hypothetical protein
MRVELQIGIVFNEAAPLIEQLKYQKNYPNCIKRINRKLNYPYFLHCQSAKPENRLIS